jgi:hypothetical protein
MTHDPNRVRHQGPEGVHWPPQEIAAAHQASQTWQPQPWAEGGTQPQGQEYISPEAAGQLGGHATRGTLAPQTEAVPVQPNAVKDDEPTVTTHPLTVVRTVSHPDRLVISTGVGQLQRIRGGEVQPVLDPSGKTVELPAAGRASRQGSWTFVDGEMLIRKGTDGRNAALNANFEWVPAPGWWARRKIQKAARNGTLKTAVFALGRVPVPGSGGVGSESPTTILRRLIPIGQPKAGDKTEETLRPDTTAVHLEHTTVEPSFEATRVIGSNDGETVILAALGKLSGGRVSERRRKPPSENELAIELYGRSMRNLTNAERLQVEMRLSRLRRGADRPDGNSAGAA